MEADAINRKRKFTCFATHAWLGHWALKSLNSSHLKYDVNANSKISNDRSITAMTVQTPRSAGGRGEGGQARKGEKERQRKREGRGNKKTQSEDKLVISLVIYFIVN